MAVVISNVLSGGGATSGGTNITASWTPDGTSQFILTVSAYVSAGSVVPVASGVTGNGLTWTAIKNVAGDNTGADRTVQYMFVAPAGGSVGGLTISWSTVPTRASWVLDKVAGADSTFGSGSLPQAAISATSSGANPTATLGSALLSGSVSYASACFESSAGTLSAGSGYTALGQDTSQSLGWTFTEWNSAGSTTATAANSTTTNRHSIIVVEVPVPIAGPTITSFQTADWTTTGATKTITVTGAVTGDKIVVFYGGDNGTSGGTVTAATASTTGGSTSAWTEPEEGFAASSQTWASSSTADVTANGTVTVTLSRTQAAADIWGGFAMLCHNQGGIGVHTRSAPSSTKTVSLTVSQDSVVGMLAIDWDHAALVPFSPSGATDVQRTAGLSNVTWYAGYWRGQAAGTRAYGVPTSGTTNLHIIAIETLAASSGTSLTLSLATETDAAKVLSNSKTVTLGRAAETETAFALSATKATSVTLSVATETSAALALSYSRAVTLGRATETDAAYSVVAARTIGVSSAAETDTAFALSATKSTAVTLGTATELSQAQSLTQTKSVVLGRAQETDAGLAITKSAAAITLGVATETDTARVLSASGAGTLVFGVATETDQARVLSLSKSGSLFSAAETETARVPTITKTIILGAAEADQAFGVTATKSFSLAAAVSAEASYTLGSSKIVVLGTATETDDAYRMVRVIPGRNITIVALGEPTSAWVMSAPATQTVMSGSDPSVDWTTTGPNTDWTTSGPEGTPWVMTEPEL